MIIRQSAFTGTNRLLKGALHCHTTRSDGKCTPEETIRLHKAHGYDFMALTDHRKYNFKNYAPDTQMTIIPGMEMDRDIAGGGLHCFHTVCLGHADARNKYQQDQVFDSAVVKDQYEFQTLLDTLHQDGNLTFYCHPEWSSTPAREFENMKGQFAMEIWNSGCVFENDMDTNAAYWDEILMQGKRIWGVAVDDGHAKYQHCNGWVRVNSENNVEAILNALQSGAFYSSAGPEIIDFYVEDGIAHVACSGAQRVEFHYGRYPTVMSFGTPIIEHAEFKVPDLFQYLRVCVVDAQGLRAWSNPIFFD